MGFCRKVFETAFLILTNNLDRLCYNNITSPGTGGVLKNSLGGVDIDP
jgi:hypothetical protein